MDMKLYIKFDFLLFKSIATMQSSGMSSATLQHTASKKFPACLEAVMRQEYALSIYNYSYNYAILHKLILCFTDPAGFLFSNLK